MANLRNMSDQELAALEAQLAPKEEEGLLDTISSGATAVSEGIRQGVINVGQDIGLGLAEGLEAQEKQLRPGLEKNFPGVDFGASAEGSKQLKAKIQAQRIRARETGKRADYPTAGNVGEFIGDVTARVGAGAGAAGAVKGARIAKDLTTGLVAGATRTPEEGESRTGNALLEAGLFAGIPLAAQAIKNARPVIDKAAAAAFKELGVKPTLSQVVKSKFTRDAAQTVERLLEDVPFIGTKLARRAQFRATEKVIGKVGKEFEDTLAFGEIIRKRVKDAESLFERVPSKLNQVNVEKAYQALDKFEADEVIRNAYQASIKKSGVPDVNVFRNILQDQKKKLRGLQYADKEIREKIKALNKVTGILNRTSKPGAGPSGIGIIGIGGGAVAGTLAGIPTSTILAGGVLIRGLSTLLTTKTGIKLLTRGGPKENMLPAIKAAIQLGVAGSQKEGMPKLQDMSDDELKRLEQELLGAE